MNRSLLLLLPLVVIQSCALVSPQKRKVVHPPVPAHIQSLKLDKPFTLVYRAKTWFQYNRKFQPHDQRILLFSDGKRVVFRSEDIQWKFTTTALISPEETLTMESNSRIASIQPGIDFSRQGFLPIPGAGIPNRSLLWCGIADFTRPEFDRILAPKRAAIAKLVGSSVNQHPDWKSDYGIAVDALVPVEGRDSVPSTKLSTIVTTTDRGESKTVWFATLDNVTDSPGTLWEFSEHRKFHGIWIASKIRMRQWFSKGLKGPNFLNREAMYELESSVDGVPDPKVFQPETFLLNHANVTDSTQKPLKSFVYYIDQGAFRDQRERAMERTEPASRIPLALGYVGVFLTAIAAGAWILKRRR